MIPVLGVPVLNRYDLLDRMLASIDVPVGKIVIVDNGGKMEGDIIRPGHNLGVSASWNLIMKATPLAPWWLLANNDIEFASGDLSEFNAVMNVATVDPESDGAAVAHMLGFAAFGITSEALERVGYFDENFHPAYDEDLDYSRRCRLAGVRRYTVAGLGLTHVGSATIYGNEDYRTANGRTHPANDAYYSRKWGGHKEGGETFDTPFNRGGHQGEWRLEPARLRDQSW